MALAELNHKLGTLLSKFSDLTTAFDSAERKRHLNSLKDKYGLSIYSTGGFRLSRDYTDSQQDAVTVRFGSDMEVPPKYAYLHIHTLRDLDKRSDITTMTSYINLSPTSQLELEDWFEMVFSVLSSDDRAKRAAGYKAVDEFVSSGMLVGLGTGSTAKFAVDRVAQKIRLGLLKEIWCIPTSERTEQQAKLLNIPLCTLNNFNDITSKVELDVAIDGADAVSKDFCLIKGGGGALLREKMVETVAKTFICIVDNTKLHKGLGPSFALPVEIVPFGHEHTMNVLVNLQSLKSNNCQAILRTGDVTKHASRAGEDPAITENGNYIVDLKFRKNNYIHEPYRVADELKRTVGVVEHGLFCGMANYIVVANPDGTCKVAGGTYGQGWWGTFE